MSRQSAEELLKARIGLDPTAAGPALIPRAVRGRMSALGMPEGQRDRYLELLATSPTEFDALVEEVVVSESWFFRDGVPFVFLVERARALLEADPSRGPARVLSMPCASGEEPYSIAMALLDAGFPASRFHIDAIDLSARAIRAAQARIYSANAFRSDDTRFRDRYFRVAPRGFELNADVAARVRFRRANLLDPGLLADEGPYDFLFCRNLLIYLDSPSRGRLLANVDRLLAPQGVLFVGHAELLGMLGEVFQSVGPRGCFGFERRPPARAIPTETHVPASTVSTTPAGPLEPLPTKPRPARPGPREMPALPPARALSAPAPPDAPSRLERATTLANQGHHREAQRLCEEEIRLKGPTAPAYTLLGMLAQSTGEIPRAATCFEKAIYLDPTHEEALLALALIAQRRGDTAAASNLRRRAERAHQEKQRP